MLRKKFVLPIKSWFSTFFHFFFASGSALYHLQCDRSDLNVKFLMFQEILQGPHVEVLSQDPNKKNSSSFIVTNMELRFEPCVFNLIWK